MISKNKDEYFNMLPKISFISYSKLIGYIYFNVALYSYAIYNFSFNTSNI